MTEFKCQALKELTEQQTRYAPPARRQAQIANAQKLLGEVESGKAYPYQYVCFRVTDYRSVAHSDLRITGDDLRHDLALFIRRVAKSVPHHVASSGIQLSPTPRPTRLPESTAAEPTVLATRSGWRMGSLRTCV